MKKETLLKLIAWERNYLRDYDVTSTARLFQGLIDSGELQSMDDWYKQTGEQLISLGICHRPTLKVVK